MVRAIHKPTGKTVAIKRIGDLFEDTIDCKRILREVILLRKIKHPNLIKISEILTPENPMLFNEIYVVMEYA